MKYKCIVEYDYPVDHKPPFEAILYLHGDSVQTDKIEPFCDKENTIEIVRCKDCKNHGKFMGWCGTSKPDDYCSYGERKENEQIH